MFSCCYQSNKVAPSQSYIPPSPPPTPRPAKSSRLSEISRQERLSTATRLDALVKKRIEEAQKKNGSK